jgi:hypothetical protein
MTRYQDLIFLLSAFGASSLLAYWMVVERVKLMAAHEYDRKIYRICDAYIWHRVYHHHACLLHLSQNIAPQAGNGARL